LEEWSGVQALDAKSIPDKCVHELFMEAAKINPDKVAIEFEDDPDQTLTYKEVRPLVRFYFCPAWLAN
jgi:non-ribosomal peptide synthetase component F